MRGAALAAVPTVLACLLACGTVRGPLLPARDWRPIEGEEARVEAFLSAAAERADASQRLRALGKLRIQSPDGSGGLRQVVIVERPDRLRLESLNLLGQTASLLVTDGAHYVAFDGQRLQRGGVYPDLLRRYAGLDLAPAEAVALLVAAPALPDGSPDAVLASGDERMLEYAERRVRFDGSGELRAVEALDGAGGVRWRAEYDGWRDVAGGRYPFAMAFSFPKRELWARLELDEAELNPPLEPGLFSLPGQGNE